MSKSFSSENKSHFYQVWNDSVVIKDLVIAILINIVLTTVFLYLSIYLLGFFIKDANIMKGYSLLIGLLGCVCGAIISMKLFKPKRIIDSDIENNENLYSVIVGFVDDNAESSIASLPKASQDELKSLGLYELFLKAEQEKLNKSTEEK
jgi:multidrug transporter EmrE-like cation transporter